MLQPNVLFLQRSAEFPDWIGTGGNRPRRQARCVPISQLVPDRARVLPAEQLPQKGRRGPIDLHNGQRVILQELRCTFGDRKPQSGSRSLLHVVME